VSRYTEPGTRLPNGARVIAARKVNDEEAVVLALTEGMAGHPYATWRMDLETGHTYWGEYLMTLNEAVASLLERAPLPQPEEAQR
jgi:hypothetical protein